MHLAATLALAAIAAQSALASPLVHEERALADIDLCLDVDILDGLLDLNVAADLNILGKGRKVQCSSKKCGFAPWVPAHGVVDVDLCVDIDLLGLIKVDTALHLGLLDSGYKRIPCKATKACPPPGSACSTKTITRVATQPARTLTVTDTKNTVTKTKTRTVATRTVTSRVTSRVLIPATTKTVTSTRTRILTVTATPSGRPQCRPQYKFGKRDLLDVDLCLDLKVGGLIDLNLAADLDILGAGHKVRCNKGCGFPTYVPARGLVDVDVCVDLDLLGLVSVDLALHLGLLDTGLKRFPCKLADSCPCPTKYNGSKRMAKRTV